MTAQKLFSIFAIFLMLLSNFSIVFAVENPPYASLQSVPDSSKKTAGGASAAVKNFSCENSSLTPREAQNIFDQILKNGFMGSEINAGEKPLKDRDSLDQNLLIVPQEGKAGQAIQAEFPSQKIKPSEVAYLLNNHYSGPFAFGLVLSDSLRIGRCENLPDQNACHLLGKNLFYRNSGEGIVADFKTAWNDFKGIFTKKPSELSDEEYGVLQARFAKETGISPDELNDLNSDVSTPEKKGIIDSIKKNVDGLKVAYWEKKSGNPIENSILTSYFTVNSQTNCSNNACVVSTYSMFDKIFNSSMSTNLVLSNFGPTLWGQANRLIGYGARWGWPWGEKLNELGNKFRRFLLTRTDPKTGSITYDTLLGNYWQKRINMRKDAFGLGPLWTPLMENQGGWDGGYFFHNTAPFRKWWTTEVTNPGGILDKLTDNGKNKEIGREIYNLVRDLKHYGHLNNFLTKEAEETYVKALNASGGVLNSTSEKALMDWARRNARLFQNNDALFNLDTPEFFARYQYNGLYDVGVKHIGTGTIVPLHGDSHHIDNIMEKFINDGDFKNWEKFNYSGGGSWPGNAYELGQDGGVQLYKIGAASELKEVPISELEKNLSKYKDRVAIIETGEKIPLDPASLNWIKNQGAGTVQIADGSWGKEGELSPLDLAKKLTHSRIKNRIFTTQQNNTTRMIDTLAERNLAGRKYMSVLDKAIMEEDNLIKNYFSLKGGAKWTVAPYAYWWAKRGFGLENLSAYMLPDSWTQLTAYLGDDKVFNDAYVDFFANEGSDQGDIFVQVLNKLPWELVLNEVAKNYKPVQNIYNMLTGRQLRSKVENLAIYTTTNNEKDNCLGCAVTVNANNLNQFSPAFNAGNKLTNYILEDTISDEARKKGTTLISYVHHMDLKGKGGDVEGQKIDLPTAKKDKTTCMDALKKNGLGWTKSASGAAALMGGTEALTYAVFGWAGIFGSIFQQTVIAPKFQDCVDYDEGYFMHFFAPSKEEKKKTETAAELSTEKVSALIDDSSKKILDSLKGDGKSIVGKAAESAKQQIDDLTKTNQKEVVEAVVETQTKTTGKFSGEELFYFWFKGSSMPSKYKTEGQKNILDPNSKTNVKIDFANGKISVNGKDIVNNPDIVRLVSTNSDIPAEEIPQNITKIGLSGEDKVLFEMNAKGDLIVKDSSVLNCLRDGVKAQTGVGFSTDNLAEAFGPVESITTNSHPNIFPRPSDSTIIAEGTPREIASGKNAKAFIKSNRETSIKNGSEKKVGLLESIQFKNGVMVYKAETNQLIVWLKHNEKAVASQNDISGLKAFLDKIKNPETGCDEPAIDLEALAIDSDYSASKVQSLNDSLKKLGPFQIFDTETKRFILHEKLENGGCVPYFKVIDKKTGEVLTDQPITSLKQTSTGLEITTKDGKNHTLDFAAENGIPTIAYNKGTPETLLSAQGKNGSFYYDPQKGQWFAENAQLLPLLEAFRQKGVSTQANADGSVSSKPGINITNTNLGGNTNMPFNLPSLPENALYLFIFISSMFCAMAIIRIRFSPKRN